MKEVSIDEYYIIRENGEVFNLLKNKLLPTHLSHKGYLSVGLYNYKTKKTISRRVHRLLMIAFKPNPNNHPIINHIDGNKLNNSLDNLEWCTHSHNTKEAFRIGLAKISDKQKERVSSFAYKMHSQNSKKIYDTKTFIFYNSIKDAASVLNINPQTLSNQLQGKFKSKSNMKFVSTMEDKWNKIKFSNGESLSDLINKNYNAKLTMECSDSKVFIEEYSDIINGLCKFQYQVFNYNLSPDILYLESEVSYMALFDFIKDNSLYPIGCSVHEFITDQTKEALKYYILAKRKAGIFYEVE